MIRVFYGIEFFMSIVFVLIVRHFCDTNCTSSGSGVLEAMVLGKFQPGQKDSGCESTRTWFSLPLCNNPVDSEMVSL